MEDPPYDNPALETGMRLYLSGNELTNIRQTLEEKKFSPAEIDAAMLVLKKHMYTRRRHRGIVSLLIGSGLLFAGCVVAVIMHDNSYCFRIALYGPSLIGGLIVCRGLVDVIGW